MGGGEHITPSWYESLSLAKGKFSPSHSATSFDLLLSYCCLSTNKFFKARQKYGETCEKKQWQWLCTSGAIMPLMSHSTLWQNCHQPQEKRRPRWQHASNVDLLEGRTVWQARQNVGSGKAFRLGIKQARTVGPKLESSRCCSWTVIPISPIHHGQWPDWWELRTWTSVGSQFENHGATIVQQSSLHLTQPPASIPLVEWSSATDLTI